MPPRPSSLARTSRGLVARPISSPRCYVTPIVPTLEFRDAFDRRVYRIFNGEQRAFVFQGEELLQEVVLNSSTGPVPWVRKEYYHGAGIDEAVGQRVDATLYAMHTDTMGTPYAATNGIGDLSEVYDIGPYGEYSVTDVDGGGTIGNRIGLAGMWYDSVTNLYFMRARHYSPFLKRFVSRDPIGVWGDGLEDGNGYGYAAYSPTLYCDPFGLWATDDERENLKQRRDKAGKKANADREKLSALGERLENRCAEIFRNRAPGDEVDINSDAMASDLIKQIGEAAVDFASSNSEYEDLANEYDDRYGMHEAIERQVQDPQGANRPSMRSAPRAGADDGAGSNADEVAQQVIGHASARGATRGLNAVPRSAVGGVYAFVTSNGNWYFGQSGDLQGRVGHWLRTGRFAEGTIEQARFWRVPGGRTAREIFESRMIVDLRSKGLVVENIRDPIGGRPYLNNRPVSGTPLSSQRIINGRRPATTPRVVR